MESQPISLELETRRLVRHLAWAGALLCALVVVYGLTWGEWLHGFLAGLSLAMAMLPEEFPVVLSILPGPGGLAHRPEERAYQAPTGGG